MKRRTARPRAISNSAPLKQASRKLCTPDAVFVMEPAGCDERVCTACRSSDNSVPHDGAVLRSQREGASAGMPIDHQAWQRHILIKSVTGELADSIGPAA